jgi:hypothetical protein
LIFSSLLGHIKQRFAKVSHFSDFLISCAQNGTHGTSYFAASSVAVDLLGGARNHKIWAHKMTRFGAKFFSENQGKGKEDA